MLRLAVAISFAAALLVVAVTARASDAEALDFTLKDMRGHALTLSQLRGHPVIVDFWATWCPPCRRQIPELERLYSRYHKSHGLIVVGVACDTIQGDGVRAVAPFVKEFNIAYPIVLATDPVLDSLGVQAIPTTLFIDAKGHLFDRIMGAGKAGELTDSTQRLLGRGSKREAPPLEDPHAVNL